MKDTVVITNWKGIIFSLVGLAVLCLIYLLFSGKKLSFMSGATGMFFLLFVLGLAMSTFSGSRFFAGSTFSATVSTMLKTLGYISFALLALTPLFTWIGLKIPLVYGYQQAQFVMAALILVKWILVRGSDLVWLFKN